MPRALALRQHLETRLREILHRVDRIEADLRRPQDADWVEMAAQAENDEVLEGLDEMGRAEAREIRAALRRMDTGRYGFCVACQRPIEEKRLQALPTTATCVYCAPRTA